MRATLVIPTLNEREGIGYTLDSFATESRKANTDHFSKDPIEWEVLVVDGGSTDGTVEIAKEKGATVIPEPRRGYGRAFKTGFEAATGDFIATMDGDGTYPAEEIPWLLLRLLHTGQDFVLGDRMTLLEKRAMTMEHRLGNFTLNLAIGILFHECLKEVPMRVLNDSQSGMWAFRKSILPKLRLTQDGMAFSEELKIEILVHGLKLEEVPIHYRERWGKPKLSSWRDGLMNLAWIVRKRFNVSRETRLAERIPVATGTSHSP